LFNITTTDKLSNVIDDCQLHADVQIRHMACALVKCGFFSAATSTFYHFADPHIHPSAFYGETELGSQTGNWIDSGN